jgi:hypothetical protein
LSYKGQVGVGRFLGQFKKKIELAANKNYTMRDTFYVVDLSDIDVVLGVQLLITLVKITTKYQTL